MAKTEKDKAWEEYSRYSKIKGCLDASGLPFIGTCITHGPAQYHIGYLQSGHFVSGRSDAVLFSNFFVNNQCNYCNMINHGETEKYRKALYKKHSKKHGKSHGKEFIDRWEMKLKAYAKSAKVNMTDEDWISRRKRYKRKTGILLRRHGYNTYKELLADGRC